MAEETTKTLSREEALKAWYACKSDEELAALYWSTPILQEMFSAANFGKPPEQPTSAKQ